MIGELNKTIKIVNLLLSKPFLFFLKFASLVGNEFGKLNYLEDMMFKIINKRDYEDLVEQLKSTEASLIYYQRKSGEYRSENEFLKENRDNLQKNISKLDNNYRTLLKDKQKLNETIDTQIKMISHYQETIRRLVSKCGGYSSNAARQKRAMRDLIIEHQKEKEKLREIIKKQDREINKLKHPIPLQAYQNDGFRKNERRDLL